MDVQLAVVVVGRAGKGCVKVETLALASIMNIGTATKMPAHNVSCIII